MVCDVPLAQSRIEPCRMISILKGEIRKVLVSSMRVIQTSVIHDLWLPASSKSGLRQSNF